MKRRRRLAGSREIDFDLHRLRIDPFVKLPPHPPRLESAENGKGEEADGHDRDELAPKRESFVREFVGDKCFTLRRKLATSSFDEFVPFRWVPLVDHDRAGEFVVPALLHGIEGNPDQAEAAGER